MSYVPAYDHDIFVSYARANNRPALSDDPATCWVTALVNNLIQRLPAELEPSMEPAVFFDQKEVTENEPLGVQLEGHLRRSALLLVILSKASAASAWCRREWEAFSGPVRASVLEGRVFVVQIDEVERKAWQGPFVPDLVPLEFRGPSRPTGHRRLLGAPRAVPGQDGYFEYDEALGSLTRKIAAKLGELRNLPAATVESDRPCVYVAEGTPDLEETRELLRTLLHQSGFGMVPQRPYPRSPGEFQEAARRDLSGALAFVQLNGRYVTPRTDDLPKGYEGLQLESAVAASRRVFRWRPRDLNLAAILDPEHRRDCETAMNWVGDVMELQAVLLEELRRLQARSVVCVPETPLSRVFVGIVAPGNEARADDVARVLSESSVGNRILPEPCPLVDLDDDAVSAYDGLLLVLDQAEEGWVRRRSQEFRTLLMRLEKNPRRQPPVFGFYRYVPPRRMPIQIRDFQVVEGGPNGDLRSFIERVRDRRRKVLSP